MSVTLVFADDFVKHDTSLSKIYDKAVKDGITLASLNFSRILSHLDCAIVQDDAVYIRENANATLIGGLNIKNLHIPTILTESQLLVNKIAAWAFEGQFLESLRIDDNITEIGAQAFNNCQYLSSIYYDCNLSSVITDSDLFFDGCGLKSETGTSLLIGRNVEYIPSRLFYAYHSFNNVVSLKFDVNSICSVIQNRAFYNSRNLVDIEFTKEITDIQSHAFRHCGIKNLRFPIDSKLTTISSSAFKGCEQLESIILPASLTALKEDAFANNTELRWVKFLSKPAISLTNVAGNAAPPFNNCSKLTDIYVPWSEGEVEGAPWGAVNATVHYFVTDDAEGNVLIEGITLSDDSNGNVVTTATLVDDGNGNITLIQI